MWETHLQNRCGCARPSSQTHINIFAISHNHLSLSSLIYNTVIIDTSSSLALCNNSLGKLSMKQSRGVSSGCQEDEKKWPRITARKNVIFWVFIVIVNWKWKLISGIKFKAQLLLYLFDGKTAPEIDTKREEMLTRADEKKHVFLL